MTDADEPKVFSPPKGTLSTLSSLIGPRKAAFVAALVLGLLGVAAALAQPVTVGRILEAVRTGGDVASPAVLLALLLLADAVFSGVQSYLVSRTGEGIVLDLRRTLIGKLLRMTVPEKDSRRTGDLISRVGTDTTLVRTALAQSVVDALLGMATFLGAVVLMAVIDLTLLLVTLACVLVATVAILAIASRVQTATREAQESVGDLAAALERVLRALRTVKISRAEDREEEVISDDAQSAYRAGLRVAKLRALVDPATVIAVQGSFVLVLGIGGARLASGDLAIEDFFAFLLYLLYLITPLLSVFLSFTELQQGLAAFGRIEQVLVAPTEGLDKPHGSYASSDTEADQNVTTQGRPEPVVRLEEVYFSYSPERQILHGVSLETSGPGLTALVGPSGGGKSTIFALLERFYDVDSGRILLDGVDVRELPLRELRSKIGYVEQDSPVMAGSVRQNLLYANPAATEGEVQEALELSNLRSLLDRLPDGLDTEVGEGGVLLSGGERQRLAIARMLLVRPRLLLLDEVTAQLDAANERALRDAVVEVSERCAVVAIAHRLSTVAGADRIVVLDDGKVVAVGTHEELMGSDPLYRELVNTQLIDAAGPPNER